MRNERRCAKCDVETGTKQDGTFTPYTLHPFESRSGGASGIAVFCAPCFEQLGSAAARDEIARSPARDEPARAAAPRRLFAVP